MMNTQDRRVRKTKKAISDALISLLQHKQLRHITIKELTDTADIHRATFYVHYKDVYDLYEQIENAAVAELSSILMSDETHSYENLYSVLIEYIFANADLYKTLLNSSTDTSFRDRITAVLEDCYLKIWVYEDKITEVTDEMRFLTAYNVQGCHAIINKWFELNCSYSKDMIAKLLKSVNDNFDYLT